MAHSEKKAKDIVLTAMSEVPVDTRKIDFLKYRSDFGDYVVIFNDHALCLIREKLVDAFEDDMTGDLKRELKLLVQRARKLDDFEYEDLTYDPTKAGPVESNPDTEMI